MMQSLHLVHDIIVVRAYPNVCSRQRLCAFARDRCVLMALCSAGDLCHRQPMLACAKRRNNVLA